MANLIWTGILYFSTSMIVYIVYRTFMNDRRAENERKTSEAVLKTQGRIANVEPGLEPASPRVRRPAVAAIGAPMRVHAAR
ncbi:MAG TPA: hypothetical protein VHY57_01220 [Rhizomicrobium sp.]|nr:hypothetical protein [Rhizomicrobium sp.]